MRPLKELKIAYNEIQASALPAHVKVALLEPILQELKNLATSKSSCDFSRCSSLKRELTETNFTSISHLSLFSNDCESNSHILPVSLMDQETRQVLQNRILEKQRIKLWLNEQIETYEDDYFEMQKILLTKREYNEELDNLIASRSYQISKQSCQKSVASSKEEQPKSLSSRLRGFFSK